MQPQESSGGLCSLTRRSSCYCHLTCHRSATWLAETSLRKRCLNRSLSCCRNHRRRSSVLRSSMTILTHLKQGMLVPHSGSESR